MHDLFKNRGSTTFYPPSFPPENGYPPVILGFAPFPVGCSGSTESRWKKARRWGGFYLSIYIYIIIYLRKPHLKLLPTSVLHPEIGFSTSVLQKSRWNPMVLTTSHAFLASWEAGPPTSEKPVKFTKASTTPSPLELAKYSWWRGVVKNQWALWDIYYISYIIYIH